MTGGQRAWLGVAAALGASALLGSLAAPTAIDWQPALAARDPWRAFSAVGVHYSEAHRLGNLVGVLVAGASGAVARVTPPLAWAWLAAWPLTQIGLLTRPELAHFGGLSGVLHAGVAVVLTFLLVTGTRAQRGVATAVSIGFVAKLLTETPWGDAVRQTEGWDIPIAPLAHTTGALAGVACSAVALCWARGRTRSRTDG